MKVNTYQREGTHPTATPNGQGLEFILTAENPEDQCFLEWLDKIAVRKTGQPRHALGAISIATDYRCSARNPEEKGSFTSYHVRIYPNNNHTGTQMP